MINEDQLEQLAIQWFQDTGWSYAHGPDIAPESAAPERSDFREVVLKDRLASAIARFNPNLPPAAVEEVVQFTTKPGKPIYLHMRMELLEGDYLQVDDEARSAEMAKP